MTEGAKKNKIIRPPGITAICIIGFIGSGLSIPLIFSEKANEIGYWYPPYLAASILIGFICMAGLWFMKKWAAYLYGTIIVINQVTLYAMNEWSPLSLIIPAIVVIIAFYHSPKMT